MHCGEKTVFILGTMQVAMWIYCLVPGVVVRFARRKYRLKFGVLRTFYLFFEMQCEFLVSRTLNHTLFSPLLRIRVGAYARNAELPLTSVAPV